MILLCLAADEAEERVVKSGIFGFILGILTVGIVLAVLAYSSGGDIAKGDFVKYKLTKITPHSEETLFEFDIKNSPKKSKKNSVTISAAPLGGKCVIKLGKRICFTAPFKPKPLTLAQCEKQKSKLGIKNCYYSVDYWAGAVSKCGGVKYMPSMEELGLIAGAFYQGNPYIGEKRSVELLKYNPEVVNLLGLKDDNFCLWSNEEYGTIGVSASGRCFFPSYTHFFVDYYRKFNSISAVCLTEE